MSLYNEGQSNWGTIFMGPGPNMETTLERVEAGGPSLAWTTETEAEYLARVREKATAKAKEILLAAQTEADAMREQAHAQGYEAGLDQAQAELEEFRQGMGASVAAVLAAIEGNAGRIAAAWREELVNLTRLCVETAVNHELSEERAALLAGLFDGATAKMAAAQRISIAVNPEDEPAVADMLDAAGQDGEQTFTVRGDASLAPGSLVLESDDSRVDNSLTARRALVENILAQLSVPADTPAEAARLAEEIPSLEPTFPVQEASLAPQAVAAAEEEAETAPAQMQPAPEAEAAEQTAPVAEEAAPTEEISPEASPETAPEAQPALEVAEQFPAAEIAAEQLMSEVEPVPAIEAPASPEGNTQAQASENVELEAIAAPADAAGQEDAAAAPEADPFEPAEVLSDGTRK